jgi:hypothetical protein
VYAGDGDEDARQSVGQYLGRAVEVLRHVQAPAPSLGIAVSTQYPERRRIEMLAYRLGGGALNETDVCGGICDDRCFQSHAGSRIVRVSLVG